MLLVVVLALLVPLKIVYNNRLFWIWAARRYYVEQRPLVLASARRMRLAWYWAQATPLVAELETTAALGGAVPESWHVYAEGHPYWNIRNPPGMVDRYSYVVNARMQAMRRIFERHPARDDFKIEKDKCAMVGFFAHNGIPIPPLLGVWRGRDAPLPDELAHCNASTPMPLFVKACHITQGFLKSVRMVKSCAELPEARAWMGRMFGVVATDPERMWAAAADVLTATLVPGFMLQGSAGLSPDYVQGSRQRGALRGPAASYESGEEPRLQAFELKAEVVWGRAYLAELVLAEGGMQLFYLRGAEEGDAEVHDPHNLEGPRRWGWIRAEGHLACVWRLVERVARLAAIDQMRVDVFVAKGRPDGCLVNENSLSSGSGIWPHRFYVAQLWAEGHEEGLSTPFGNASSTVAYLQTDADLP